MRLDVIRIRVIYEERLAIGPATTILPSTSMLGRTAARTLAILFNYQKQVVLRPGRWTIWPRAISQQSLSWTHSNGPDYSPLKCHGENRDFGPEDKYFPKRFMSGLSACNSIGTVDLRVYGSVVVMLKVERSLNDECKLRAG